MSYVEVRDAIRTELLRHPDGGTWAELREHLALPYDRPCPARVGCLEREIGLVRAKGAGRAYLWKLARGKEQ